MSLSEEKKFTNLNDLAKFHLSNNNTLTDQNPLSSDKKIKLPNLFTKSDVLSGSGTPLVLPKLTFGNKLNSLNPNQSSAPMGLPKLNFPTTNSNSVSPLQSSLQKIMELKKLSLTEPKVLTTSTTDKITNYTPTKNNNVDLSSTFIPNSTQSNSSNNISKDNNENLTIDCSHQKNIAHDCEIDCKEMLIKILNVKKRNATKFGRTFCRRYAMNWKPKIRHEFKPKNQIPCYNFESPSPDDLIRMAIAKAKFH